VQFEIRDGFKVDGAIANIDLAKQSDDVVRATFEESQRIGEQRGLWLPAGAGSLAVATEVEVPTDLRTQLLDTAEEGANLFITVINGINAKRKKAARIPLLQPEEYRERFEDQLPDNLLVASTYLPTAANRQRLLIPSLNHAISREEVVDAVGRASDNGMYSWSGRMDFLNKFPADALSGFDPNTDPEEIKPLVLPTAYDTKKEGTVAKQKKDLERLQIDIPELGVAPIFTTAILGERYKGKDRNWEDSYSKGINLEPVEVDRRDYVVSAYVNDVGSADVRDSYVRSDDAARLLAR
jgi:hypothetical protein